MGKLNSEKSSNEPQNKQKKMSVIFSLVASITILSALKFLLIIWTNGFSWDGLLFSIILAIVVTGLLKLNIFVRMKVKQYLKKGNPKTNC